ncbi:MAG: AEC family transporter [Gammaproteobacteria bacterium]|nr:AEC family transporter [Gammaproteobacteria bacterium]MCP5424010.1 AEC family transporter [Gammaproteobacteria bacterium]
MQALFEIVLPVFGVILTGYLARQNQLLGDASAEALNRFVYYITIPPLLFLTTARVPLAEILNWPFIAVYVLANGLTLLLAVIGARLLFGYRTLSAFTFHAFAATFSNTVYMGIPLFLAAFGRSGTTPIVVAALVSNLLFIGSAIVCFELGQAAENGYRRILRDVGEALLRNPILLPLLAGLLVSYLQFELPAPIARFLDLLANAAGPTALFTLGLTLYGHSVRADLGEMLWLVFLKLLANPLITWALVLYVLPLEPFWANSAVLISAIPTGALVFVFAQRYNVFVRQSAAVVVVSTALSLFTLSALLSQFADG